MTTHTTSITTPTGSVETYARWGDSAKFVVFGRDAAGVRKGERPGVAQWCATEQGARNVLPDWQRYGGEWVILPVTYIEQDVCP
jgi:hypothetical protein